MKADRVTRPLRLLPLVDPPQLPGRHVILVISGDMLVSIPGQGLVSRGSFRMTGTPEKPLVEKD
jgi:hypothetical protein